MRRRAPTARGGLRGIAGRGNAARPSVLAPGDCPLLTASLPTGSGKRSWARAPAARRHRARPSRRWHQRAAARSARCHRAELCVGSCERHQALAARGGPDLLRAGHHLAHAGYRHARRSAHAPRPAGVQRGGAAATRRGAGQASSTHERGAPIRPVHGLPEVQPGDDLAALIIEALAAAPHRPGAWCASRSRSSSPRRRAGSWPSLRWHPRRWQGIGGGSRGGRPAPHSGDSRRLG